MKPSFRLVAVSILLLSLSLTMCSGTTNQHSRWLEQETESESGPEKRVNFWRAHGLLMAIAWAILVPLAIGASLLRRLFPGDLWFKIHMGLNLTGVICVIIGFALAVAEIQHEDGSEAEHFKEDRHWTVGLVVFLFAFLQAVGGLLRPHLPKKHEIKTVHVDDSGEVDDVGVTTSSPKGSPEDAEPTKSTARKSWEIGHRVFAVTILALAWWNCYTGIELYEEDYGGPNLQAAFWGVLGSLIGVMAILGVAQQCSSK
jgi:hypothetical protein